MKKLNVEKMVKITGGTNNIKCAVALMGYNPSLTAAQAYNICVLSSQNAAK